MIHDCVCFDPAIFDECMAELRLEFFARECLLRLRCPKCNAAFLCRVQQILGQMLKRTDMTVFVSGHLCYLHLFQVAQCKGIDIPPTVALL